MRKTPVNIMEFRMRMSGRARSGDEWKLDVSPFARTSSCEGFGQRKKEPGPEGPGESGEENGGGRPLVSSPGGGRANLSPPPIADFQGEDVLGGCVPEGLCILQQVALTVLGRPGSLLLPHEIHGGAWTVFPTKDRIPP